MTTSGLVACLRTCCPESIKKILRPVWHWRIRRVRAEGTCLLPEVVTSLDELDAKLAEVQAAAKISDDAMRNVFRSFSFNMKFDDLPDDPFSEEYRQYQLNLYRWLRGRDYDPGNERSHFDVEAAVAVPFPYITRSTDTVGTHFTVLGFLYRHLKLSPDATVLEFGPGWGNVTLGLARMGHQITVIDIEQNFLDLIRRRAEILGVSVETVSGDFMEAARLDKCFDVLLFFECFHHCSNHQALVGLFDRLVSPGGRVVFGAEPITEAFYAPWGIRLDGESLWAVRANGWLELGFRESYFREMLARYGWCVEKHQSADIPWLTVFVASRQSERTGAQMLGS